MQKIYKAYPTGGYSPTLENFWNYRFYITGKFYDYAGREDIFQKAEVLILGNPEMCELGKFIPNRYIWRIKNMWLYESKFLEEKDEMTFKQLEVLHGKSLNDEEIARLMAVTLNQCHWQEQEKAWKTGIINLYIEVEYANLITPHLLLQQKIIHDYVTNFDENGVIQKEKIEKKFFHFTDSVSYDMVKRVFIRDGEEILFSPYNAEKKQKFLEMLILESPGRIAKEDFLNMFKMDNKQLLELKRSLLAYEFERYLWLSKNFVEEHILISGKNKWYMIIGNWR